MSGTGALVVDAVPLGTASLSAWLDRLESVLADAADVDVHGGTDRGLLDAIERLQVAASRIGSVRLSATAEVDRRGAATRATGALSTAAWLRAEGMNPSAAQREVALATSLERNAATRDALASGAITTEQAHVVASAVDALSDAVPEPDRSDAEQRLLAAAPRLDPCQLKKLAVAQAARIDPTGSGDLQRDEKAQAARRELSISRWTDGMWHLRGVLDTEGAAHVLNALGPLAKPRPSTAEGQDMRSPAKRMADGLVSLAQWAAQAKQLPDSGGLKPQVMVLIDYAALKSQTEAGTLVAETLSEPISPQSVRRIACDARILPAVLGGAGEVLELGREKRNADDRQRKALIIRDGGCAFPGCDRPPAWTDAHHVVHWADGGGTDLDNLVLLCGPHHDTIHHEDWTVTMIDRRPVFAPPPTPPPEPPW